MNIKIVDYSSFPILKKYYDQFQTEVSDISLTNIYMWRNKYNFHYVLREDYLFIVNVKGEQYYFSQPIGSYENEDKVVDVTRQLSKKLRDLGQSLIIKKADDRFVELMQKHGVSFEHCSSEDEQDYIYSFEELRALSGKKYHKKKNHINKFDKTYLDWNFRWYTPEDYLSVKALLTLWREGKEDPNVQFEYEGILDVLQHIEHFDLNIALLSVGSDLIGFTIAEVLNHDLLIVHIEKADVLYEGAFTKVGHTLYNQLQGPLWINREQDLGLEGLRKSKMSYHPVRFVSKNELHNIL